MNEHIEDILVGGRPMTKLEKANKEIERLNNIIKGLDNTIENLTEVVDKKENLIKEAIDYIEYYLAKGKTKNHRKFDISVLDILKGTELTENDKKQVKWLREEFNVGGDKECK